MWKKEKEVIQYLNAANSKEYYNIAPGGPSRPDGLFLISDSERDKMSYLNDQLKHEEYYGIRLQEGDDGKFRLIFVETETRDGKKYGKYYTVTDETYEKIMVGRNIISGIKKSITVSPFNNTNSIHKWLDQKGFIFVSKEAFYKYLKEVEYVDNFNNMLEVFKRGDQMSLVDIKLQNDVKIDIKPKKVPNVSTVKQKTIGLRAIDRLREHAKTSDDCRNFVNLVDEYSDLSFSVIYNAVTGNGSVSGNSFNPDDIKCTRSQKNQAADILDYELNFANMLQLIGGRHDYYYAVLAYCYKHNKIDNNELLKRFRKKYKTIKPAQSIEAALDEIERIYNFKKPQGLKVSIKYEYLVDKTNR